MANMRIEMDINKFVAMRIAMAAAHLIKANELFLSSKALLAAVDFSVPANMAALVGVTEAEASALWQLILTAVTNTTTARTDMAKIDQGIEV